MLKNFMFLTSLNEAPDDEEEVDEPEVEETTEDDTEPETEEESTEEPEGESTEDEPEAPEDDLGDDSMDDTPGEEPSEGEEEVSGEEEPEADPEQVTSDAFFKLQYFKRLSELNTQCKKAITSIEDNTVALYAVETDKFEFIQKENNYVLKEFEEAVEQLNYILQSGIIVSMETKRIKTIFNKLQTKTLILIERYAKLTNKYL